MAYRFIQYLHYFKLSLLSTRITCLVNKTLFFSDQISVAIRYNQIQPRGKKKAFWQESSCQGIGSSFSNSIGWRPQWCASNRHDDDHDSDACHRWRHSVYGYSGRKNCVGVGRTCWSQYDDGPQTRSSTRGYFRGTRFLRDRKQENTRRLGKRQRANATRTKYCLQFLYADRSNSSKIKLLTYNVLIFCSALNEVQI